MKPGTFVARRLRLGSMPLPTPLPGTTLLSSIARVDAVPCAWPTRVDLKIEVELADDESELEIELTW